jgi:hypothetical protein
VPQKQDGLENGDEHKDPRSHRELDDPNRQW